MLEGDPTVLRVALQIVAVLVGGAGVQLIIFLLRRRAEIRALDTTADSSVLGSANQLIDQLQEEVTDLRAEVRQQKDEFAAYRAQSTAAMDRGNQTLADDRANLARLSTDLARVRSDLVIAHAQIDDLQRRR